MQKISKTRRSRYERVRPVSPFKLTERDLPLTTVNWTAKNNELKSGFFLEHTLMVAQFMINAQLACKKMRRVEFISQE